MSKKDRDKGRPGQDDVLRVTTLMATQIMLAAATGAVSQTEAIEAMGVPPAMYEQMQAGLVQYASMSITNLRQNGDTWAAWQLRLLAQAGT